MCDHFLTHKRYLQCYKGYWKRSHAAVFIHSLYIHVCQIICH